MTDERRVDRALDAFLAEGSEEVADRVVDAALEQIGRTRQRRVIRMPLVLAAQTSATTLRRKK